MGNYGGEYKEYYDRLKKEHNINSSSSYTTNDLSYIYRGNNTYCKYNKSKDTFISNLIMVQLVGTIMLFLFVFGTKYSENENLEGYYLKFKKAIEQEYRYVNLKIDVEGDSIQWLKENEYIDKVTD